MPLSSTQPPPPYSYAFKLTSSAHEKRLLLSVEFPDVQPPLFDIITKLGFSSSDGDDIPLPEGVI